MRRHRRIRTGYRSGTMKKSKKLIFVRILFVILCAAALTFVSVLLGSYLKGKANAADSILATEPDTTAPKPSAPEVFMDGIVSVSDADKLAVCAAHIDISSDGIAQKLASLSEVYNAVSVNIHTDTGELVYLSEALLDYVGMNSSDVVKLPLTQDPSSDDDEEAPDAEIDVTENIKALLSEASKRTLRTSAVFNASLDVLAGDREAVVQSQLDGVVLGELKDFGFDEVIITGLVAEDEAVSYDTLKSIISYLAVLRQTSADLDIGVMLPSSVYLVPQSASFIKTLAEYVDFLAISINTDSTDMDEAYYSVYDDCHSLKGNFSVYNIRGVITNSDPDISSAIYTALKNLSVDSTQFSVFVEDPVFIPEHSKDVPDDTEEEYFSNDNALRAEDYAQTEEAQSEESHE